MNSDLHLNIFLIFNPSFSKSFDIDENLDHFTDILGYHKTFQIVDYTLTNMKKFSLSKIVSSMPAPTPDNLIQNLCMPKWNPNNINIKIWLESWLYLNRLGVKIIIHDCQTKNRKVVMQIPVMVLKLE